MAYIHVVDATLISELVQDRISNTHNHSQVFVMLDQEVGCD